MAKEKFKYIPLHPIKEVGRCGECKFAIFVDEYNLRTPKGELFVVKCNHCKHRNLASEKGCKKWEARDSEI